MSDAPPQWPFAGDSPILRARKVAWAYQALARELAPDRVSEMDARFRSWGEFWVAPVAHYDPDDWVTAEEAGAIVGVSINYISALRRDGRLAGRLDPSDRRRFLFRVGDLQALKPRRRGVALQAGRTDKVIANGATVSKGHSANGNTPSLAKNTRE